MKKKTLDLSEIRKSKNVCELLDEDQISKIGNSVISGYEIDYASTKDMRDRIDFAMGIAKQTVETKDTPWEGASNIKYPLITQAVIDFAARIYPEFVQNENVVKFTIVGSDQDFAKEFKAKRVQKHMSTQLLNDGNTEWEDNLDKLLHIWPIVGTVFKKTHYCPIENRAISELCLPDKIVVNNNVMSIEKARRISHVMTMYSNDLVSHMRSGLFRDIDPDKIKGMAGYDTDDASDDDLPLNIIEQQRYIDLDEDGYSEPYIVTVHKESREVLRIVSCISDIEYNSEKKVKCIKRIEYYTDFHFIRSPDGGFYSVGIGTLLYPLNETINTLFNQLVDSGTLANQAGGLIGGGIRMKSGEFRIKKGEWKRVETVPGATIAQNIFPIPVNQPSTTLFQLLQLLIGVGKDLISANDPMQGKGMTQNVSPSTMSMMVEQGMKVYNAIHKRLYRSFRKEFKKIFDINGRYLLQSEYMRILDDPNANVKKDYDAASMDILPIADPNMASVPQRMAKAQAVMAIPGVDPYAAKMFALTALQLEESQLQLLAGPPPNPEAPPPPEVQLMQAQMQDTIASAQLKLAQAGAVEAGVQIDAQKVGISAHNADILAADVQARIERSQADVMNNQQKTAIAAQKAQVSASKTEHSAAMSELEMMRKREKDEVDATVAIGTLIKPEPKKEPK